MVLVCWSVGGGAGTSVVVAGLALASARADDPALIVDLGGDQPTLFGAPEPEGPGLAGWLRAGPDVPADGLRRVEVELAPGIDLLPRGSGPLGTDRASALGSGLAADERWVVVDAGLPSPGSVAAHLVDGERTLLVARACPVALRRLEQLDHPPVGVVVVREPRRSVTWQDVAAASGAPVVAELEIDPAVAAAVDAGLGRRVLPRRFLRVLGELR